MNHASSSKLKKSWLKLNQLCTDSFKLWVMIMTILWWDYAQNASLQESMWLQMRRIQKLHVKSAKNNLSIISQNHSRKHTFSTLNQTIRKCLQSDISMIFLFLQSGQITPSTAAESSANTVFMSQSLQYHERVMYHVDGHEILDSPMIDWTFVW